MNRCLLLVALLLFVPAMVGLLGSLIRGMSQPELLTLLLPLVSGLWLLMAYIFGRRQRFSVAGAMIVALVLAALVLTLYVMPAHALLLLPLGSVPVALAALLLNRRAISVVAILTLLALTGMIAGASLLPPARIDLALPAPDRTFALGVLAGTLALLALLLVPLRGAIAGLLERAQQSEATQIKAEQLRQTAEDAQTRLHAQLERQQQELHILAQHIGDGLIAVGPSGRIKRANPIAQELWALVSSKELIDQPFEEVQRALSGHIQSAHYVDIIQLPIQVEDIGTGYTHVLLDQRESARLARLRGELIGLLTDEMRNPLTSMITALDLTLGQQNLPEDVDRVLIGTRRNGQRLLQLVTMLLEIDQIEQNPDLLRRSPTSLSRVIEAGIAQTAPMAQQGAVTVVVEYGGDCSVVMDGERMQRAFANLLEHALRHSPPYSIVQVRTTRQNGGVEIRITDQGPALSPEQREVLFDQRAVSDERGSPALGLAFSRLLIEKHGGRIWADSNGAQGSSYTFTLPIEKQN